jgi:hypothetical protein
MAQAMPGATTTSLPLTIDDEQVEDQSEPERDIACSLFQ